MHVSYTTFTQIHHYDVVEEVGESLLLVTTHNFSVSDSLSFKYSLFLALALDVISRNIEGMGSLPFILFSATSVVYVMGSLTIILLQNRIGRKGVDSPSELSNHCGYRFLITFTDMQKNALLLANMVGLSRYGVVVSYEAEAQYSSEFIPTTVRGRGMANIHVAGFAFTTPNSYLIYASFMPSATWDHESVSK